MKQITTIFILGLISLLISCDDRCDDGLSMMYQDKSDRGSIGVIISENNTNVNFDSVTLIEPIQKNISLGKIPLSLKDGKVKIRLKNNNTLADTIVINYDVYSNYDFSCSKASLGAVNFRISYRTFNTNYFIRFIAVQ